MFIDDSLEMADNTAVFDGLTADQFGTGKEIRAVIGDNATADLSGGEPIYVVIEVTEALAGATSYEIQLYTHTAATGIESGTLVFTTGAVAAADFAVGKRWIFTLPEAEYEAFLGLAGLRVGSAVSAGKVNAYLTKNVRNWQGTATRVPATDPAN